jgi:hypothetical protein
MMLLLALIFTRFAFASEECKSPTISSSLYACFAKKLCGDCKYQTGKEEAKATLKADKLYHVSTLSLPVEEVVHQGFPRSLYGKFMMSERNESDLPVAVEIKVPDRLVFQGAVFGEGMHILALTKKLKIADLALPSEIADEVKLEDIDKVRVAFLEGENIVKYFRLKRSVKICGKLFPEGSYGREDSGVVMSPGGLFGADPICFISRQTEKNAKNYKCQVECEPGAFEDEASKKKK